jgi:hypothetical protein
MIKLHPIALLAPLGLAVAVAVEANPAKAALTYYLSDTPDGLVIETSGSLNVSGPKTFVSNCSYKGAYSQQIAVVCTGGAGDLSVYSISGPSSFAAGINTYLDSQFTTASGIKTGLFGAFGEFIIAPSYVSGDPIVSSSTAPGKTLADLGLTTSSGTLGTWTLASTGDTISVKVFNPVPGPLPLLGAGAAFGFSRRLRQRIQRCKAPVNA